MRRQTGHAFLDGNSRIRHGPDNRHLLSDNGSNAPDADPRYHRHQHMLGLLELVPETPQDIVHLKRLHRQDHQIGITQRLLILIAHQYPLLLQPMQGLDIPFGHQYMLGLNKTTLDQPLCNRSPEISTANNGNFLIHNSIN